MVKTIELKANEPKFLPIKGDYIEVLEVSGASLGEVTIALNNATWFIPLTKTPLVSPFSQLVMKSSKDCKVTLLIGQELFRTQSQGVTLLSDLVGLAKEDTLSSIDGKIDVNLSTRASEDTLSQINTKLSQPTSLKSEKVTIDNSGGTADAIQALFGSSTPSKRATLYRDPNDTGTVYVGDDSKQVFPFNAGDVIETDVSDLSVIYVKVPAGVVCNIYVLWEV